ncbi:NAD-dependent epimerase/dehydratase family protein [Rothia nasimurium]|uniref:NAD-dependent epimerase/dehydratase family protein n=1 Tax=Rothia nasimurium TaxID=85336 RepID=UPI001F0034BF|nr:NAD-dependent epimerase/dehydratase family protein [Rothia nasimurium]
MVVSLRPLTPEVCQPARTERVLVTGASGLLGREVVFALLRSGYSVRAFQRGDSGIAQMLPAHLADRFDQVQGSLTDQLAVRRAVTGVQGIIHLAAKVSVVGDWEDYRQVNVEGTRTLLEAARAVGIGKFLHTSSPSVAHTGASIVGEGNPPASPDQARGNYARSKAESELLALSYDADDFWVGVLRPHIVWGPGDTQLVERVLERAAAGRLPLLNQGTAMIDTLYIDNGADAFVRGYQRLEAIRGVPLVVTNGQPRPVGEIIAGMCTACGVKPPAYSLPASVAYGLGLVMEKAWARCAPGQIPPLTSFLAEQLSTAHWFDQRTTRELLDWSPAVSLEEGYERLGDYYGRRFRRNH